MSLKERIHKVEVRAADAHVRVLVGGEVVADTRRALVLSETGYPDRWYVPIADVRAAVLEPSDRRTHCPYKGDASYVHLLVGGARVSDAAWTYAQPVDAVAPIAGHLSFYPAAPVTVEVDGTPLA